MNDPRVGEYLQPEPMLMRGELPTMHPYAYAMSATADDVDPSGENPIVLGGLAWCIASGTCEAAAAGAFLAVGATIILLSRERERDVSDDDLVDWYREYWGTLVRSMCGVSATFVLT